MNSIKKSFNIEKEIIYIFVISLLFLLFPIIFSWDSGHYFNYLNFFEGTMGISEWDTARGPIFPTVLFVFLKIFGKNYNSVMLYGYILFLIGAIYLYKTLKMIFTNYGNHFSLFFVIACFLLNPIVFGYYHLMLTESLITTFSIVLIYFFAKIKDKKICRLKKILKLSFFFGCILSFGWLLKQPYGILTFLICFLFGFFFNVNTKISKKLFLMFLSLSVSLALCFSWNNYIIKKKDVVDQSRTNSYFMKRGIMNGIGVYNYYGNNLIKSYLKEVYNNPKDVLKRYFCGYLGLTNLIEASHNDVTGEIKYSYDFDFVKFASRGENYVLGTKTFTYLDGKNYFFMLEESLDNLRPFLLENQEKNIFYKIILVVFGAYNILFSILGLVNPILLIYMIIYIIKNKQKSKEYDKINLEKIFICSLLCYFIYAIMFVFLGAIIDRYIFPVYVMSFPITIINIKWIFFDGRLYNKTKELKVL